MRHVDDRGSEQIIVRVLGGADLNAVFIHSSADRMRGTDTSARICRSTRFSGVSVRPDTREQLECDLSVFLGSPRCLAIWGALRPPAESSSGNIDRGHRRAQAERPPVKMAGHQHIWVLSFRLPGETLLETRG